jgi:uncharacterized GH25 family protein
MRHLRPVGLATLLGLASVAPLQAHDFWIEPSTFTPAPGQRISLRLRVGERWRGDLLPRDPGLLKRFLSVGPGGEMPVPGRDYAEPAGVLTVPAPGLYTVVYESHRSPLALEAGKFEEYLKQEGLEAVSAWRARRGERGAAVKEVFSRCAKSLLAVGGGPPGEGYDRILGQRLELVPEANPYALAAGGTLPMRLLYGGRPLAGALVAALPKDRPQAAVSARSDAAGRVRLRLDGPGVWLVKAVHMVAAPKETAADWESLWASLTFQLPGG